MTTPLLHLWGRHCKIYHLPNQRVKVVLGREEIIMLPTKPLNDSNMPLHPTRQLEEVYNQRHQGGLLMPLRELRSLIITIQELWLFVKSGDIRNPLNCWSGNCLSRGWWDKSPKISGLTFVFSPAPTWLFRKPPRHYCIGLFEDTNFCVIDESASQSCPWISNWFIISVERGIRMVLCRLNKTCLHLFTCFVLLQHFRVLT